VPGRAVTISGEGKGGPAGFAKGGAKVTLEPGAEGTRLSYEVEASVGGKLAQLGSRLIDGFAKKLADEFFERFKATVEGSDTGGPGPDEGADDGGPEDGTGEKKSWLKRVFRG
jgi:carbon monoxide dehydrogenase subunit G